MIGVILVMWGIIALIAYRWVKAIDYMKKHYPDYKGEDLFGEDKDKI